MSRILTGKAKVSDDKYKRVRALIDKYNYSPNAMARSLSETHSRVIGMVLTDAGNPYYNSVFSACWTDRAGPPRGTRSCSCNWRGMASCSASRTGGRTT